MRAPWRAVRIRRYEPTASPVARGVVAVAAIAVTVLLVVQAVDAWGSAGRLALMVVLFLAATELTSWAVRLRSVIPETAASLGRQIGTLGAVVAGGGLVAAGLLAAGRTTSAPSGRTALLLGLAAAVVPVGLLASRWWRSVP